MVKDMGLRKRPKMAKIPWTEQELEILRIHYGAGAWISRVQSLLPGRTKGAISMQAQKMGIKESLGWQPDEISILQKYYPKIGSLVAERLPGRTVAAIKTQAARLGCISRRRMPNKVWTTEELKRLEDNISLSVDNLMNLFPDCTRHVLVYMRKKIKDKGKI
ncbi:hypothetical protein A6856_23790 [Salmonella enterica]|nr:hypothetical protein [Salmonella enterica]EAS2027922.1 hypothetical protein [Salmonella enterica]EAU0259661.1 hypothetical protein [Salmonella enterica]